jgi:hypothetical protein
MSSNLKKTESKFFEQSRLALSNAKSEPAIKSALSEYSMTEEKLASGEDLYQMAYAKWQANIKEEAESKSASNDYKAMDERLQNLFVEHRDKVKIFFTREPDVLLKLSVKGRFPVQHNEFYDLVGLFYGTLKQDAELLAKVAILKITIAEVDQALAMLDELLQKRSVYVREMAESQAATQTKNDAIITLRDWMDDFYSIAKVALYDQPQLLEALGVFVRS